MSAPGNRDLNPSHCPTCRHHFLLRRATPANRELVAFAHLGSLVDEMKVNDADFKQWLETGRTFDGWPLEAVEMLLARVVELELRVARRCWAEGAVSTGQSPYPEIGE